MSVSARASGQVEDYHELRRCQTRCNDVACHNQCRVDHPEGAAEFDAWSGCHQTNCVAACAPPDAGADAGSDATTDAGEDMDASGDAAGDAASDTSAD